ncbi:MAG: sugar ABC transporter permease [Caldilineaceae bacterium]|nr:sugar ABC transporter permease [Caldilineaceae bacterium]
MKPPPDSSLPSNSPPAARPQGTIAPLLSTLFALLGAGLLAWLGNAVWQDPGIRMALGFIPADAETEPALIMAFLTQFGIILPLLVIGLALFSFILAWGLLKHSIITARWAHAVLAWLSATAAFMALVQIIRAIVQIRQPAGDGAVSISLPGIIGMAGLAILFALARYILQQRIDQAFYGQEGLQSRDVRVAWMLLIPTLAVFFLVAARPLEQTFIRSLTDKRFAGGEVPTFIGLQNYQELMGVRVDMVDCRAEEESAACVRDPRGNIRWASIDRELLTEGFRTVWTISLPFQGTPRALAVSALDQDFMRSIQTTILFAVISVTLELLIALFMAMTVNSKFVGRGLMRTVMLVPWAIPTVVSARLWELMLKDSSAGVINRALMDLSLIDAPKAWLSDVALQLPTVIMVDAWKTAPFMALLLLAGLQSIPRELYEAADVDGAGALRKFFAVTLPLLRPTIAVALVFRTLDALRVFDLFNVLFGRQQLSMATYNYETLVNSQRDGYASAISIILFLIISIFAVLYMRALKVETE